MYDMDFHFSLDFINLKDTFVYNTDGKMFSYTIAKI